MAKGQAQAAGSNLATTNAIGAQELAGANTLQSAVTPTYTNFMETGYGSPQQQQAATESTMGAAAEPFNTASFQAANRAAATNNPADLTSQQDQLALEKSGATQGAANSLQAQQTQGELAGASGLEGMSEKDLAAAEGMYGLGPGTLSARAAGGNAPLQAFGDVTGMFKA